MFLWTWALFYFMIILLLSGAVITDSTSLTGFQPTVANPFVFFHIQKTGGSSMRDMFADTVLDSKLNHALISCHDKVSCYTSSANFASPAMLNRSSCATVIMGHFTVVETAMTLYNMDHGMYGPVKCRRGWWDDKKYTDEVDIVVRFIQQTKCLTFLREPLARLWSHYYFFLHKTTGVSLAHYYKQHGAAALFNNTMGSLQSSALGGLHFSSHESSKRIIDTVFDQCIVGIEEQYEQSVYELSKLFPSLKQYERKPHVRVNSSRKQSKGSDLNSLSADIRRQLAPLLLQDALLWTRGRARAWNLNSEYPYHIYSVSRKGIDGSAIGFPPVLVHPKVKAKQEAICWNDAGNFWIPQQHCNLQMGQA